MFALYLVLLTLLMCISAMEIYKIQISKLDNSMVSPVRVLQIPDSKEIFEMQERNTIINSSKDSWGNDDLTKNKFCDYFAGDAFASARDFIFSDLKYRNRKIADWGAVFQESANLKSFCMDNYDFKFDEDILNVRRAALNKNFRLMANDRTKINFVVDVDYVYSGEISVSKNEVYFGDSGFVIPEVKAPIVPMGGIVG